MRKPIKCFNSRSQLSFLFTKRNQAGQALVEYVLMVLFAITLVAVMATSFRKTLKSVWGYYIKEIAAACPGCALNATYRF